MVACLFLLKTKNACYIHVHVSDRSVPYQQYLQYLIILSRKECPPSFNIREHILQEAKQVECYWSELGDSGSVRYTVTISHILPPVSFNFVTEQGFKKIGVQTIIKPTSNFENIIVYHLLTLILLLLTNVMVH